jgi:HEPN domain-containing protein
MPERDKLIAVIREWVAKAENDFMAATHALKLKEHCPTDVVCFHAQQVVEKYLKGLLVLKEIDFPKTHSLKSIMALLPARIRPDLSVEEQSVLTNYATGARYPGWPDIPLKEARRAVAVARRVRRDVRRCLPPSARRMKRI